MNALDAIENNEVELTFEIKNLLTRQLGESELCKILKKQIEQSKEIRKMFKREFYGVDEEINSVNFPWGQILKIHSIGEYKIIEYSYTSQTDVEIINFHPYLKNIDTSRSFKTLDEALVGVIAYKHEGLNCKADKYFMKMIEMQNE